MELDLSGFQRELAGINEVMDDAVQRLRYGSFADRNPGLGKMTNCPLCGHRRREMPLIPCCNTAHATTQRIWTEGHSARGIFLSEGIGKGFGPRTRHEKGFHQREWKEWDEAAKDWLPKARVVDAMLTRNLLKKFKHKRHSNLTRHQIHDMVLAMAGQHYETSVDDNDENDGKFAYFQRIADEATKKSLDAAMQFRNTTQLLLEGLPGFHEPKEPTPLQSIPNLAEKVVRNIRKQKSRKARNVQKRSRKANRMPK